MQFENDYLMAMIQKISRSIAQAVLKKKDEDIEETQNIISEGLIDLAQIDAKTLYSMDRSQIEFLMKLRFQENAAVAMDKFDELCLLLKERGTEEQRLFAERVLADTGE